MPLSGSHRRTLLDKHVNAARQLRAETLARMCSDLFVGGWHLIRLITAGMPRSA
jgi:hypothetical protein